MKIVSYDIVFQEVPNEVTLALNISGCPHRCEGCHSAHLQQDIGEPFTKELLDALLQRYQSAITCVCFMGGDQAPETVMQWCCYIHDHQLKTAWYSGFQHLPDTLDTSSLDYLKLGPYVASLGGLKDKRTNQRFYRRNADNRWSECTSLFWRE